MCFTVPISVSGAVDDPTTLRGHLGVLQLQSLWPLCCLASDVFFDHGDSFIIDWVCRQ